MAGSMRDVGVTLVPRLDKVNGEGVPKQSLATSGEGKRPRKPRLDSADYAAPSVRSRLKAALIRARWVNACGKLPRASPLLPVCSAYRPRWLP